MRLHLFLPTAKTAALHLVPVKSYSKNTHPPSFLKWAVDIVYLTETNSDCRSNKEIYISEGLCFSPVISSSIEKLIIKS